MPSDETIFLLDTNIFIEAQNKHYGFDICPGFWDALVEQHLAGRVFSIDHVRSEVTKLKGSLSDWIDDLPMEFFMSTSDYSTQQQFIGISNWVQNGEYLEAAKRDFASIADGWLVACACENGFVVVTHEARNPDQKRSAPIPNLCEQFKVEYIDPFNMLRRLGVSFRLS